MGKDPAVGPLHQGGEVVADAATAFDELGAATSDAPGLKGADGQTENGGGFAFAYQFEGGLRHCFISFAIRCADFGMATSI